MMIVSTAHDMNEARRRIGAMWGLGRELDFGELARCLEMEPRGACNNHTLVGQDVCRRPTGPQRLVVQAMLEGFIPPGAPSCARR